MARDLAGRFPAAAALLERIDGALGIPLSRVMFEGPEAELQETQNAQPAILAHSAAALALLRGKLGQVRAAAGHSLGEYTAYLAAGALEPEAAARLVRRRGELMAEAGRSRPGTMAAVLGLPTSEVEAACRAVPVEVGVVVAANQNGPDQTVISGDPAAVAQAGEACRSAGAKRVLGLKVSGAFHSPLMASAVPGLQAALAETSFRDPGFPVLANATAAPVTTADEARRLLAEQLGAPVRWMDSMRAAAALAPDATFIEIGPGTVLTSLLKRILPDARTLTLGTAEEVEGFLA